MNDLAAWCGTLAAIMERDKLSLQAARVAETDLVAEIAIRGGMVPNSHWHDRYRLEQRIRIERMLLEEILLEAPMMALRSSTRCK